MIISEICALVLFLFFSSGPNTQKKNLHLTFTVTTREKKRKEIKICFRCGKHFLEMLQAAQTGCYVLFYFFFLNARDVYRYIPFNRQHMQQPVPVPKCCYNNQPVTLHFVTFFFSTWKEQVPVVFSPQLHSPRPKYFAITTCITINTLNGIEHTWKRKKDVKVHKMTKGKQFEVDK